ncbi:hypothetical protein MSAN_00123300 [Mycena sanguinolenta]|uniref:Uncharacterized protein n=1 Tax=Mycena sanguinolenta TaxID=230812 RepID=A0A8H7DKS7_9AGAR|nr:hypothetical protein MSAN_00123300 [Mycena sanguinolenta]
MDSGQNTAGPSSRPHPSDPDGGGPQTGQKRRAADHESPPPEGHNRPSATKKKRKTKKKPKVDQFHLKKDQIDETQRGTKNTCYLHGYLLLQIVRSDIPPPAVTQQSITAFERRWTPNFLSTLQATLRAAKGDNIGASQMAADLRRRAQKEAKAGSQIAKDILQVKETYLVHTYSILLASGLETWAPDVMGAPDTPYNQVHATVFFESFSMVATSFAYVALAPTLSSVNNPDFVKDVMCSFLYSYMRRKFKVEDNEPGKLAKNSEDDTRRKRRKRLMQKCLEYASKEEKFPDQVLALVKEECCNSDDESGTDDSGKQVYFVNKKTMQSASATAFVQKLDARRTKMEDGAKRRRGKGSNWGERTRIWRDAPSNSEFSLQRPTKVPLDYFSPSEFNDLPAKARFNYVKNGVALPLVQFLDNKDWKTMDKSSFMEKYGNQVLKQYDIPTEEEMTRAGNTGWDSDDAEEINLTLQGSQSDAEMAAASP